MNNNNYYGNVRWLTFQVTDLYFYKGNTCIPFVPLYYVLLSILLLRDKNLEHGNGTIASVVILSN